MEWAYVGGGGVDKQFSQKEAWIKGLRISEQDGGRDLG